MTDLLNTSTVPLIGTQLQQAVREARIASVAARLEQGAITGGLASAITRTVFGEATGSDGRRYEWTTSLKTFRGRGRGAPKQQLGDADALMIVEFWDLDMGAILVDNVMPIHAERRWNQRAQELVRCDTAMKRVLRASIVVDFSHHGYLAARAATAAEDSGAALPPSARRPLGDVLAEDFLACTSGGKGFYYDTARELLVLPDGRRLRFRARYRITTKIERMTLRSQN